MAEISLLLLPSGELKTRPHACHGRVPNSFELLLRPDAGGSRDGGEERGGDFARVRALLSLRTPVARVQDIAHRPRSMADMTFHFVMHGEHQYLNERVLSSIRTARMPSSWASPHPLR